MKNQVSPAANVRLRRNAVSARQALRLTTALAGIALASAPFLSSRALAQSSAASVTPSGGQVVAGQAAISGGDGHLQIIQSSDKAIIDWNSFSIGADGSVNFDNGNGVTLNRVTGASLSSIDGLLSATGSVYLINSNGVIIGRDGVVRVGGDFVASTLDLKNDNFLRGGDQTFAGPSLASVVNLGQVGALGGDVSLLSLHVGNAGTIAAPNGTVGLIGGSAIVMRDSSVDGGNFLILRGGADASVDNRGAIAATAAELRAQGGNVYALAGNTDGIVNASTVEIRDGVLYLTSGGDVSVSGSVTATGASGDGGSIAISGDHIKVSDSAVLDASARAATGDGGDITVIAGMSDGALDFSGRALAKGGAIGGDGGFVETSGASVDFTGARIDTSAVKGKTGDWRVDPEDITVDAAAASTIETNLATTNVTLQTTSTTASGPGVVTSGGDGDIVINSGITWSSGNSLTLDAYHGIDINADIDITGAGGLVLVTNNGGSGGDYNIRLGKSVTFSGAGGALTINGDAYTLIYDKVGLDAAKDAVGTHYALADSLDLSSVSYTDSVLGLFQGTFAGLGHEIDGLTVNSSGGSVGWAGLNGTTATIRDFGLNGGSIANTGNGFTGGIAGENMGILKNVHSSATITANNFAGGIAGINDASGAVIQAYATGDVTGVNAFIGGLVGYNDGTIDTAYATGNVQGNGYVGGLVGTQSSGGIRNAFAMGRTTANLNFGSLVGLISGGTVDSAFATGRGHLIGVVNGGTFTNTYMDGDTSGTFMTVGQGSDAGISIYNTDMLQTYSLSSLGFDSTVWSTGSGLYPYLTALFPDGPKVIRGFALDGSGTGLSNATIGFYSGGNPFADDLTTGANGYYYGFQPASSLPDGAYAIGATVTPDGESAPTGLFYSSAVTAGGGILSMPDIRSDFLIGETSETTFSGFLTDTTVADGIFGASRYAILSGGMSPDIGYDVTAAGAFELDVDYDGSHSLFLKTLGGDLTVSKGLTLSNDSALSLDSSDNLYINANIVSTDANAVVINTGGSSDFYFAMGKSLSFTGTLGGGMTLDINGNAYSMTENPFAGIIGYYALVGDFDATGIDYTSSPGGTLTGTFEGLGHTISNLNIDSSETYSGLFSESNGTIRDLGIVNANVNRSASSLFSGVLVGVNGGMIANVWTSGSISGYTVGGLAGFNSGDIHNSFSSVAAYGSTQVGGVVGYNYGSLTDVYATGTVLAYGSHFAGGLVGYNAGSITSSYAAGYTHGDDSPVAGGLVGENFGGTISDSYFDTDTTGQAAGIGDDNNSQTVTGLTTAEFLNGDASGLSSRFSQGSGLYPYLNSFYPVTPQAISGYSFDAYNQTLAGGAVWAYSAGSQLNPGGTSTGANGFWYALLPAGTLADTGNTIGVLVAPDAISAPSGVTVVSGLDFSGNTIQASDSRLETLWITTGAESLSDEEAGRETELTPTFGSTLAADLAGNLVFSGYHITASGDFDIDEYLASYGLLYFKAGGDLTVSNVISLYGDGELTLDTPGWLTFNSFQDIADTGHVTLNTGSDAFGDIYRWATGASMQFLGTPGDGQTLTINGNAYTLLYDETDLLTMDGTSGRYAMGREVDASSSTYTNFMIDSFSGIFTGLGNSVDDLYIEADSTTSYRAGMFAVNDGIVRDVGLLNAYMDITGAGTDMSAGALVGVNSGVVRQVYALGAISSDSTAGNLWIGGLVGLNQGTGISDSIAYVDIDLTNASSASIVGGLAAYHYDSALEGGIALGDITIDGASGAVGGLVGLAAPGLNTPTITDSAALGNVTVTGGGSGTIGGLVGSGDVDISGSYAAGDITFDYSSSRVGGLVGYLSGGSVANSYAIGDVMGTLGANHNFVGGLVGDSQVNLTNVYATGQVYTNGSYTVAGGLVGSIDYGTISNAFATGAVTLSGDSGIAAGLVGSANSNTISNAYAMGAVTVSGENAQANAFAHILSSNIFNVYATGATRNLNDGSGVYFIAASGTNTLSNAYYDSDTTGLTASQAAGATGLTTPELQSVLQTGFDSADWGGGSAGLYPYLKAIFADGVEVFEGYAYGADGNGAAGSLVTLYSGGSEMLLGQASVGANGYYYSVVPTDGLSCGCGNAFGLTLTKAGSDHTVIGASYTDTPETSGVFWYGSYLKEGVLFEQTQQQRYTYLQYGMMDTFGSSLYGDIVSTLDGGKLWIKGMDTSFMVDDTIDRAGAVLIQSEGDLSLDYDGDGTITSAATGDAIVLAANGSFSTGMNTLVASNGRWLVYTQDPSDPTGVMPAGNNFNSLTGKNYYGDEFDFATGTFASAPNSGNRFVYAYQPNLTVTAGNDTVTYNGGTQNGSYSIAGWLTGDAHDITGTPDGLGGGRDAATYTITPTLGDLASDQNYGFTFVAGSLLIEKAALTLSAVTDSKTYDGTDASDGVVSVTGLQAGDSLDDLVQSFDDRNAGTGKTLSVTNYALDDGNGGDNYDITLAAVTGDVAKATLTITPDTDSKTYDGTTDSDGIVTYSGLQTGDSLDDLIQSFDDRNAGSGKGISITGYTLDDGNNGDNYNVILQTTNGFIGKAALTLSAGTDSRTYDGTTDSDGVVAYSGLQTGDSLDDLVQTFDDRNAGTGKGISVTGYTIDDGNNGDNYTVTTETATGDIARAALTLTAVTDSKTYDGTRDSDGVVSYSGLQTGDSLNDLVQAFDDRNAGTGKGISVTGYTLNDGNGGDNYTVTTETATGDIAKAALTLTAVADSKTYDGTRDSDGIVSYSGLQTGDSLNDMVQSFDDRNAGSGKGISVTGYTLDDGNGGGNYDITRVGATGDIARASLILSAVTDSKTYDGTRDSDGIVTYIGLQTGDSFDDLVQTFDDKNAGTGKGISVTGYTIDDGNNGDNYDVTLETSTGDIAKAGLVASLAGSFIKTYDGTSDIALTNSDFTISGTIYGTDDVGIDLPDANGYYNNKNAGSKTVNVYDINLTGTDSGNYTINNTASSTGTINKAALTLSAVTDTKTYDGLTTSDGVADVAGLQGSDTVSGMTQYFDDKNAGAGKILRVANGYTIHDGNNGDNYTVTLATVTGTIDKAALTLSAVADTKTYDGTEESDGAVQVDGLVSLSDTVTGAFQSFDNRNAGSNKTLTVGGYTINDGNGGNNYTVTTETATGTIDKAALTLSAVTDTKTYDKTNASSGTVNVTGLVSGDSLTGLSQSFTSHDAGRRTLAVDSGYTVNDGNGGNNYDITTQTIRGTINQAQLTLTASSYTKTYDDTTSAVGTVGVSGLVADDTVSGLTQRFTDWYAGDNKTITVGGYTVNDGNNGYNYDVVIQTATGTINRAALTLSAVSDSKTYDGTVDSDGVVVATGLVGNDTLARAVQQFDNKNAGSGKTINVYTYFINDGEGGGNYDISFRTATGDIARAALTLSAVSDSKTYDGTTASSGVVTVTGLMGDDSIDEVSQNFSDKNAGSGKTLVVGGYTLYDENGGNNYTVTTETATGTIDKAVLTASLTDTVRKTYDGTTVATLTDGNYRIDGLLEGDDVSLDAPYSGTYSDKNADNTVKTVSVTGIALTGDDAGNYTVNDSAFADIGWIDKAQLTASLTGSVVKTYNGNENARLTDANYTLTGGIVAGEDVKLTDNLAGYYDDKNAGTGKTISVNTLGLIGADSDNYIVNGFTSADIGIINPADLVASLTGSVIRTYDGTTAATLTDGNYLLSGVLSGDDVALNAPATGNYADKNAGGGKIVMVNGITISGADAGNYTVNTLASAAIGTIDKAQLAASLAGTTTRTYDGTALAALADANYTLSGVVEGDDVTLTRPHSGVYADKNAGYNKTVAVNGLAISGGDADNYTINTSASAAIGTITQASLVLSAVADTRTYDGTTASSGQVLAAGLADGDTVTGATQVFNDRNAGSKTLTVGGYTVNDGNGGGNYVVTTRTAAGTIEKAALTLAAVTDTKTYDGTTASDGVVAVSGLVDGDTVTGATQAFDDRKAGSKTLAVGGYTVNDGNGGGNYVVATRTAAGTIDRAVLVAALTGTTVKTYDGTKTATLSDANYTLSGLIGDDDVALTGPHTGTYADKNAGSGKTVTVNGIAVTGADADNYVINVSASGDIGIIDKATLLAGLTGNVTRSYNGTTAATLSAGNYALDGLVAGDDVSVSTSAGTYADKNAGSGKVITVNGIVLSGADAGNYTVNGSATGAIGIITQAALAIAANDVIKAYGQPDPDLTWRVTGGALFGDDGLTGALSRDPGEGIGVYAIQQGTLAASTNYSVTFTPGTFTIANVDLHNMVTPISRKIDPSESGDFLPQCTTDGASVTESLPLCGAGPSVPYPTNQTYSSTISFTGN